MQNKNRIKILMGIYALEELKYAVGRLNNVLDLNCYI